jgi:hypothetical protein
VQECGLVYSVRFHPYLQLAPLATVIYHLCLFSPTKRWQNIDPGPMTLSPSSSPLFFLSSSSRVASCPAAAPSLPIATHDRAFEHQALGSWLGEVGEAKWDRRRSTRLPLGLTRANNDPMLNGLAPLGGNGGATHSAMGEGVKGGERCFFTMRWVRGIGRVVG